MSARVLRPLVLPANPAVLDARRDLLALLNGEAAYLPLPADSPAEVQRLSQALAVDEPIRDDAVLVVSTSGTTGTPKGAMHTAGSLRASADATAEQLGGPGSWLLALPPHHIAGMQVMLRSLAAGHDPVVLDLTEGFNPVTFAEELRSMRGERRYTSLVPGQLWKALSYQPAVEALRDVDGILVGGAATGPDLLAAAFDARLPIVRTYGMSETAGGCVYDGSPLRGVQIKVSDPDDAGIGRVALGGPTLALGYRNLPNHPAFAEPGWFQTDDLGRFTSADSGDLLEIVGRADEAISTGGLTVIPQIVESVLQAFGEIAECAVFGLPDDRLGEKIVAAVVLTPGSDLDVAAVRELVTKRLDRYAVPREIFYVDALPLRGPGKVDRRALVAQFS
ncbi:MAG: o-succinylbenzoate--CoA ligase [Gordonia sp. (in: high G+C Gram-positive bacteria)]|uniref:o-succinylbenzoate--CoA ligase n=1 Tax=Gordonia sp. (in: high G+C Gram-positive bacteria) TaxID=84139 RepID=UPI003C71581F